MYNSGVELSLQALPEQGPGLIGNGEKYGTSNDTSHWKRRKDYLRPCRWAIATVGMTHDKGSVWGFGKKAKSKNRSGTRYVVEIGQVL